MLHFHGSFDTYFLESEQRVTISMVEGMKEINDPPHPFRIRSISRYTAELIGVDSTSFSDYRWGGYVKEVKNHPSLQFHPFAESSYNCANNNNNFTHFRPDHTRTTTQLHLAFLGVLEYLDKHGIYPGSYCEVILPFSSHLFASLLFYSIRLDSIL